MCPLVIYQENGSRLSPVEEERLRLCVQAVERECVRLGIPRGPVRVFDAQVEYTNTDQPGAVLYGVVPPHVGVPKELRRRGWWWWRRGR